MSVGEGNRIRVGGQSTIKPKWRESGVRQGDFGAPLLTREEESSLCRLSRAFWRRCRTGRRGGRRGGIGGIATILDEVIEARLERF